jgi:hypothetical protein
MIVSFSNVKNISHCYPELAGSKIMQIEQQCGVKGISKKMLKHIATRFPSQISMWTRSRGIYLIRGIWVWDRSRDLL